jgi:hypothetical protein
MPPKECQANSGVTSTVSPADSPIYQAARAFQAGQRGALPLHSNWSAAEASACDPACQYGTCVKVWEMRHLGVVVHSVFDTDNPPIDKQKSS